MRPRSLSLRTHVALVIALVVGLLSTSLSIALGLRATADMRAALGNTLIEIAHQVSDELTRGLRARSTHLQLVAGLDVLHPPHDVARVQSVLNHLLRQVDAFDGIALIGPDGKTVASAGVSGIEGTSPLTLEAPVKTADGTIHSILLAHLRWAWAEELHSAVMVPFARRGALDVVVVDRHGIIVLGPPALVGQPLGLPLPVSGQWIVAKWPDGRQSLTGFAPPPFAKDGSDPVGWQVVAREPVEVGLASVTALRRAVVQWGAALAVVFALLGWLSAGWVAAPLARIAAAADRVRAGQRHDLPLVSGPHEIEALSASLRALVHDLLHREAALVEMEDRIQTDPLTGLLNRSGLLKGLDLLIPPSHGSRRAGDRVACLFIDLDGFKAINDTYGHAAGDTVLQAVARRLERCLRGRDMIGRMGGDEFVMLLRVSQQTGLDEATVVAERAIAAVGMPLSVGTGTVTIGCSIGIALSPDDATTADTLLRMADEALYVAKHRGRNRACLHPAREGMTRENGGA
ncbi:MAG: GGDEF domain-containing protein [Rhodospirillaceae bacterium]